MFIIDDIINAIGNAQATQAQQKQIQNAQGVQQGQYDESRRIQGDIYGRNAAMQNPWIQGGQQTLAQLLQGLQSGAFTPGVNPQNLANDPGYQFRMQQAQQALQRSAAATGGLNSGAFLKGLDQYSQGLASQEYGDAWNRDFQAKQARLQSMMGLSGMGLNAAQNLGQLGAGYANAQTGIGTHYADAMSSLYGAMGNNQAAGYQNNANSIGGMFRSLGQFATQLPMGGGYGGGFGGASPMGDYPNPYGGGGYS